VAAAVWRCRPDFTGARQRGGADRPTDRPAIRSAAGGHVEFFRYVRPPSLRSRNRLRRFVGANVTRSEKTKTVKRVYTEKRRRTQNRLLPEHRTPRETPSENKKEIRRDSSVSRILSPTRLDGRSVPTEAAASQEIGPRPVSLWSGRRRAATVSCRPS